MTDRELMQQACEMLKQAKDAVADWGAYASEYFQHKHNLQGDIDDIQAQITALSERLEQPEQDKFSCGVDFADGLLTVSVVRGHADGSMEVIHTEQIALAQPTVKDSLTPHPSIIEDIADNLLQDHVELMAENKQLRESLQEILYENYAPEHYTDETIDYEMGQGNMMMPAVKRAYALVGRGRS